MELLWAEGNLRGKTWVQGTPLWEQDGRLQREIRRCVPDVKQASERSAF